MVLKRKQSSRTIDHHLSSETQYLLDLLSKTLGMVFRQILWRKAAELELTYSQGQVLYYVEQHPGCRMGEVARAFEVTVSAMTQIVDRLEQKTYLRRGVDPSDRRVYTLDLTPGGRALVEELYVLQQESLEAVLKRMSARNRQHVIKGLEALVDAASRVDRPLADADSAER